MEEIRLDKMKIEYAAYPNYLGWLNDSETTQYMKTKEADINSAKRFIAEKINSYKSGMFRILIDYDDSHGMMATEWIGTCTYYDINLKENIVTLGIMICKEQRGKGVGKLALKQLMEIITNNFGVTNFKIAYFDGNIAAEKCYSSLGFKKEIINMKLMGG